MIKRFISYSLCAAAVLGLIGTAPALAAQPYPLNFKTFAFNASGLEPKAAPRPRVTG